MEVIFTLSYWASILEPRALWFAGLFAGFTLLGIWLPAKQGQKIFRDEYRTDVFYWFLIPLICLPVYYFLTSIILTLLYGDDGAGLLQLLQQGREPFTNWPLWLQVIAIRLIADLVDYWVHRSLHRSRLWKWHAIHHMPKEVDWLTSARSHPLNTLLELMSSGLVTVLIGFDPAAFAILVPFTLIYGAMVHSNVSWDFGPLRYVFASPRFHRWHHTSLELGGDKNYASVFAFIDLIFGTFYLPKDDRPDNHPFGIAESIPENSFLKQTLWPFRQR